MIRYYTVVQDKITVANHNEVVNDVIQPIWIDIINPTLEEEHFIENKYNVEIPTINEEMPLELSTRHYMKNQSYYISINIISSDNEDQNVIFILKNNMIITSRISEIYSFNLFTHYIEKNGLPQSSVNEIFLGLIEASLDQIENNIKEISEIINDISKTIFDKNLINKKDRTHFKPIMLKIGHNGDAISKNHESLASIYQSLTHTTKQNEYEISHTELAKMVSLIKESNLIKERASFLSSKNQFMLDVSLGMINIEQNIIIKKVSIAALVFFPPTIIASIYGMNFHYMPELKWEYGYFYALGLIVLSSILPYGFFKLKDWM